MGSVACWKRHKSANYHAATECLNEMIDMRMKTILFERQSELLVGKPRRKIVTNVGLQYFYFPTSSTRAENRLQNSRNKRKRTKIASDNLLSYVTICLNGDCLSRNAERLWGLPPEYPIWQQSLRSSPSKGKPCTWRRETVSYYLICLTNDVWDIMRDSANVLNSLAGHSQDPNYKFERLYRLLLNENL